MDLICVSTRNWIDSPQDKTLSEHNIEPLGFLSHEVS